jgi:hypothetical protein
MAHTITDGALPPPNLLENFRDLIWLRSRDLALRLEAHEHSWVKTPVGDYCEGCDERKDR